MLDGERHSTGRRAPMHGPSRLRLLRARAHAAHRERPGWKAAHPLGPDLPLEDVPGACAHPPRAAPGTSSCMMQLCVCVCFCCALKRVLRQFFYIRLCCISCMCSSSAHIPATVFLVVLTHSLCCTHHTSVHALASSESVLGSASWLPGSGGSHAGKCTVSSAMATSRPHMRHGTTLHYT